jgi:cobalt/nickel transport protein
MLNNRKFYIAGFLISLFLAGVVSFYASSSPDGLEKVAEDLRFSETAKEHTNADGTFADYGVKGIDPRSRASVGVAGVAGVIGTAIVAGVSFTLIARKPKKVAN